MLPRVDMTGAANAQREWHAELWLRYRYTGKFDFAENIMTHDWIRLK